MDSKISTPNNVSRIDVSAENDITAVAGMSRSGKSGYVKRLVSARPVLLVWDPDAEYVEAGITRAVYSRTAWRDMIFSGIPGRYSFVRPIERQEFEFWALTVMHRGHCTAVAEETADVTYAGKAPPQWGQLIRKGGKRHISIFAITQFPSESDKTAFRNARRIVCFKVDRDDDIKAMVKEMRVPATDIGAIPLYSALIVDKHHKLHEPRVTHFRHAISASKTA